MRFQRSDDEDAINVFQSGYPPFAAKEEPRLSTSEMVGNSERLGTPGGWLYQPSGRRPSGGGKHLLARIQTMARFRNFIGYRLKPLVGTQGRPDK